MGALRSALLTLAVFAAFLYSTNSQRFSNENNDYDYDGGFPGFPAGPGGIPWLIPQNGPSRQQRPKQGDSILFPAAFQQPNQGARPQSPVNLSQRPLQRPLSNQRPNQQQQQGNNNNNFPNSQQQPGNNGGNFPQLQPQRPQVGGNTRPVQQGAGCNCASTQEYNPVCGSDNTTYTNPSHITCSNNCGRPITILYYGTCRATTAQRG